MKDILNFISQHPFLAFLLIWMIAILIEKLIGAITISIRGWPPEHLDKNGDFKKEDEL